MRSISVSARRRRDGRAHPWARLGRFAARAAGRLVAAAEDPARGDARVPAADVHGVGAGADLVLQRCLHPDPRPQASGGAGRAGAGGMERSARGSGAAVRSCVRGPRGAHGRHQPDAGSPGARGGDAFRLLLHPRLRRKRRGRRTVRRMHRNHGAGARRAGARRRSRTAAAPVRAGAELHVHHARARPRLRVRQQRAQAAVPERGLGRPAGARCVPRHRRPGLFRVARPGVRLGAALHRPGGAGAVPPAAQRAGRGPAAGLHLRADDRRGRPGHRHFLRRHRRHQLAPAPSRRCAKARNNSARSPTRRRC